MPDIRILAFGAMALMIASFNHTSAYDPQLKAHATGAGEVAVESVYAAPEACWAVEGTSVGAPDGSPAPAATLAATVNLKRLSPACAAMLSAIPIHFAIPDAAGARTLQVYYVEASGKLLKTENTPIKR
jgi:hypothetical protein